MLKKILGVLVAVIAIFVVVVATRPDTFELKRSLQMNAPPDVVFAQVNDFKAWSNWSPWDKLDTDLKRTYGDIPAGVGATYHWVGENTGEGGMKITESKPGEHVGLDLEFIKPFPAMNRTTFDFVKTGEGTTVTWAMTGKNNFMSKAMGLFKSMDSMVGPDFEKGLANMKIAAEADAVKKAAEAKAAADAAAAAAQPPTDAAPAADAGTP